MKTTPEPLKVKRGGGVWLELEDDRRILDCISSWWVTIHGHAHPALAEALYQQAQRLEHVIFAGFTHDPAEQLAQKLLTHLPSELTRVFYSDNGSTAVEVALKMAYRYWQNIGQSRTTFIAFEGGYHGDTIGAMSIGAGSTWWQSFQALMFDTVLVPFPETYEGDAEVDRKEAVVLDAIAQQLKQETAIGIFIEPLIQGSAGMRMCRPQFLQALRRLADQFNVLLIYDEVMTGFGRTGELFACVKSAAAPDIICLSKGLSGGCLPLAVTMTTEAIYQAFYQDDPTQAFYHGHSYTGNPLACATGVVSLELLEQNSIAYQQLEALHWKFINHYLLDHPRLERLRVCGTIAAMEIKTNEAPGYFNAIAPVLKSKFLEAGFLLRPLGNTLYIMPPYCITPDELESIYDCIDRTLNTL